MADNNTERLPDGSPPVDEALERAWAAVDDDPDLEADLGYEAIPLDVLVTSNRDTKVMFLPRSEEKIRDETYVIADEELACDPIEQA